MPRLVDTSVVVAGVAGFKTAYLAANPSASFLRDWLERETFVWLVSEEILSEYKAVLTRLGVRRHLVGQIINLLREEADLVEVRMENDLSPDPNDNAIRACAEQGGSAFIATLNRKDFPTKKSPSNSDLARRSTSDHAPLPAALSLVRVAASRRLTIEIPVTDLTKS